MNSQCRLLSKDKTDFFNESYVMKRALPNSEHSSKADPRYIGPFLCKKGDFNSYKLYGKNSIHYFTVPSNLLKKVQIANVNLLYLAEDNPELTNSEMSDEDMLNTSFQSTSKVSDTLSPPVQKLVRTDDEGLNFTVDIFDNYSSYDDSLTQKSSQFKNMSLSTDIDSQSSSKKIDWGNLSDLPRLRNRDPTIHYSEPKRHKKQ